MREPVQGRAGRVVRIALDFCAAFPAGVRFRDSSVPWLGQDFFPYTDTGQLKLHLRARTGMRVEETARLCDLVEDSIRQIIPQEELASMLDNIGLPYSGINMIYSNSAPVGTATPTS